MSDFKNVRVIGFDFDQTLYPKSSEIDEVIQEYIYKKIAKFKNCSLEEAKELFCSYYPKISGRKALIEIGIPNAENIIQEALDNADISKFLVPNQEVVSLLKYLKQKYKYLSLITGSNKEVTVKKLNKLGIPLDIFNCVITGEVSKSDGSAFKKWLNFHKEKDSSLKPGNFLYIGDKKDSDIDIPTSLGIKGILVNIKNKDNSIDIPQFGSLTEIKTILL